MPPRRKSRSATQDAEVTDEREPADEAPAEDELADKALAGDEPLDEGEPEPSDEPEAAPSDDDQFPAGRRRASRRPAAAVRRTSRRPAADGRGPSRRPERRERPALTAGEAAKAALRQVAELTAKRPEGVIGVQRTEDGWSICVEVVEDRRIPSSTDIL